MTQQKQIYRCNVCGNLVELLHVGGGELICCGQKMELLKEKTQDQGMEKHVPVIEKTDKGIKVKVGSIPHPMAEDHYISWIEVSSQGRSCLKFLKPGDQPEAEFGIEAAEVEAREYCTVHGLWKKA